MFKIKYLLLFCCFIQGTAFAQQEKSSKQKQVHPESVIEASERTQLVLLGTGTPSADPQRSGPCVAVIVDGQPYLVDFGPGLVRRAMTGYLSGIRALNPQNLTYAFSTHLHSDHTTGFPDLIFTPWVLGRKAPLQVYGPKGIKNMTEHMMAAYQEDIDIRVNGYENANAKTYEAIAHEIEEGVILENDSVKITAFKVNHGQWKHAFGYRFDTPDRVIVISGDTAPSENLIKYSKDCDILVHEVYQLARYQKGPASFKQYHGNFHTSSVQLGEIANKVKPKLLVLYHQLLWGSSEESLMQEIKDVYDGPVVYGNDMDKF